MNAFGYQIEMSSENSKSIQIDKNTAVSLGMVVVLIGAISMNEVRMANLRSDLAQIQDKVLRIEERMDRFTDKYMTKDEVLLRLESIDLKLEQINEKIKEK